MKVKAQGPKKIVMDEKSTWIPTWYTMDNVSWSTKWYVGPTSKRYISHKFWQMIKVGHLLRPLDEDQGLSQSQGHGLVIYGASLLAFCLKKEEEEKKHMVMALSSCAKWP
jgi:hypothetical protein